VTRPADDLLLAYRGTAYFLRWLSLLSDDDYDRPGAADATESRRLTISRVGYEARGFARLAEHTRLIAEARAAGTAPYAENSDSGERLFLDAARTADSPAGLLEERELGATLPARALRYLVEHSAVQLSVEWRDLPDGLWDATGFDENGAELAPAASVWLRARRVWTAAVELGNGASWSDFPPGLADRITADRELAVVQAH
jgi:maleylpyruvate isomerase